MPGRSFLARCAGLFFVAMSAVPVCAQPWFFIDVYRESDLEYGAVVQSTGVVTRIRTDPYIAKFKISAKMPGGPGGHRFVNVALFPPPVLLGPIPGTIPYTMAAAYNANTDDPVSATQIAGSTATIMLNINEGHQGPGPPVYSAYVYVFGSVDVGNVPTGHYEEDVTLVASANVVGGGEGCDAADWLAGSTYTTGDWASHLGTLWRALWWTQAEPGTTGNTGPWEEMGPCGSDWDAEECYAPLWTSSRVYEAGDWATRNGRAYRARHYTRGNVPETSPGVWDDMGPCDGPPWGGTECDALAWSSTLVYQAGDWVTQNGKAWRALFYTLGNSPATSGSSGPWEEMGPCDGSDWNGTGCAALAWAQSRIYNAGDEVTHAGAVWQAQHYTRGQMPGQSSAWQNTQSCTP